MPPRPLQLLLALLAGTSLGWVRRLAAQRALALVGVHVVDVERGRLAPNHPVIVASDRITRVGPTDRTPLPAGAEVVRASGRCVMPAMWDMHVHLSTDPWLDLSAQPARSRGLAFTCIRSLLLTHGNTGVRDMGGNLKILADPYRSAAGSRSMIRRNPPRCGTGKRSAK